VTLWENVMSEKKSAQGMLNVVGFMLIVLGLGLDGTVSLMVIGAAILTFLVALLVAIGSKPEQEADSGDQA